MSNSGSRSCASAAYFSPFWKPRRAAEEALTAVIREAYVQGLSIREMGNLVQALGGTSSLSLVRRLARDMDLNGRRRLPAAPI
ncbi:MAG: hypothetical protein FP825_09340 [Hyphomonas sp.]|nr:hypothetical protein [Hyphomonas sp.]MBU3919001.1 transposase [Alphaproteobacteria bacterium]MBU4162764.1 transposase [Alphaproteobacteria bacterium]